MRVRVVQAWFFVLWFSVKVDTGHILRGHSSILNSGHPPIVIIESKLTISWRTRYRAAMIGWRARMRESGCRSHAL